MNSPINNPTDKKILEEILDRLVEKINTSEQRISNQEISEILTAYSVSDFEKCKKALTLWSQLVYRTMFSPEAWQRNYDAMVHNGIPEEKAAAITYLFTEIEVEKIKPSRKLTESRQKIVNLIAQSRREKVSTTKNKVTTNSSNKKIQETTPKPIPKTPSSAPKSNSHQDFKIKNGEIVSYHGYETKIIIPETVQGQKILSIGQSAFRNKNLESVKLPEGLQKIQSHAFESNKLTSIVIPDSVTYIGTYVFRKNNLTKLALSNKLEIIPWSAFSNNNLTTVSLPKSVRNIGISAFSYNRLSSINIPNNVTHIQDYAFANNNISNLSLPNSIIHIGGNAFNKNQLTDITIPESVEYIGEWAFGSNQIDRVTIRSKLVSIGKFAFSHNKLTNVVVSGEARYIHEGAFTHNHLSHIRLSKETHIYKDAFDPNVRIRRKKQRNILPWILIGIIVAIIFLIVMFSWNSTISLPEFLNTPDRTIEAVLELATQMAKNTPSP